MIPAPTISSNGGLPAYDGHINRYVNPEVIGKSWYNPAQTLIHVNGIQATQEKHRDACMGLSLIHGAQVLGVYNDGGNMVGDLLEALMDKLTLAVGQAGGKLGVKVERGALRVQNFLNRLAGQSHRSLFTQVDEGLSPNKATQSLFRLLVFRHRELPQVPLHLHSQGNLIGSNALTAVAIALGSSAIRGARVYSYGSPTAFWPSGIQKQEMAFHFDPIVLLSMDSWRRRSMVGYRPRDLSFKQLQPITHGFTEYMAHDGGFVVHRFQYGTGRALVGLDTKGLAEFMSGQMPNNAPRTLAVLRYAQHNFPLSRKELAIDYLNAMGRDGIARMHRADPAITQTLIDMIRKTGITIANDPALQFLYGLQKAPATA